MPRTMAELPKGTRITDYISLGVLAKTFPLPQVQAVLAAQNKTSQRQRDLPAHVVVYYVIALALFMPVSYREVLRCLLEGLVWLLGPQQTVKITGKSGISQARTRLGWAVLQQLHDLVVKPIATRDTPGAGYRGWRLVSLDGSTLEVADEQENVQAFGRPAASRGASAYPQIRFVALVENGTHVLFGSRLGSWATGEISLAREMIGVLQQGMLCLADRYFFGFGLWNQARARGADLLWRVVKNRRLPVESRLLDGSYLSRIYPSERDRRHQTQGGGGAGDRVPAGRGAGRRTPLSPGDHDPRSEPGTGPGIGGALSRALGNRDRPGRTEDPPAGSQNRVAEQDTGPGPTRILRAVAGPFCPAQLDAGSGFERGRRPRPAFFSAHRAGGPTQVAPLRCYSPLGRGRRTMRRCWMKSCKSRWSPVVASDARVG